MTLAPPLGVLGGGFTSKDTDNPPQPGINGGMSDPYIFSGYKFETFPRDLIDNEVSSSGGTGLIGRSLIWLPVNAVVNDIAFTIAAGATNPVHWWWALTDTTASMTLLASSADQTNTAMSATLNDLAMTSPYTVTATGLFYLVFNYRASSGASMSYFSTAGISNAGTYVMSDAPAIGGQGSAPINGGPPANLSTQTWSYNTPRIYGCTK